MKHLIFATAMLLPLAAFATELSNPQDQALGQEVMECVSAKVQLRAALIAAQQRETATGTAAKPEQRKVDEGPPPPAAAKP